MKIHYIFMMLLLFTFSVNALETYPVNQEVTLRLTCTINNGIPSSTATYNLSVSDQRNGTYILNNVETTSLGNGQFAQNITFPRIGSYLAVSHCYDGSFNTTQREVISVTAEGNELTIDYALIQIFLLVFFGSLIYGYYKINREIDFDKWYKKILAKYEYTNTPKAIFSNMTYFLAKETFMVIFILIFPLVMVINNLIISFNIENLVVLTDVFLILYVIGFAIEGVLMFGKLQEFIVNRVEEGKKISWGVDE